MKNITSLKKHTQRVFVNMATLTSSLLDIILSNDYDRQRIGWEDDILWADCKCATPC